MRKTLLLLVPFAGAIFCYGCATTDNTNNAGNANNINAMNANVNNSVGKSSGSALSDADRNFVAEAAKGGMLEVELGRLATERGESVAVKQFGKRMIDDHTKANNELKQTASAKSIPLPTELDAKGKATMDRLSKLKGEEFDRAYMDDMVEDHTKDVSDFQREANSGADSDVKAFAAKTLPTLQEHLRMAQSIAPKERREEKQEKSEKKK
jgi:putative membrane protein